MKTKPELSYLQRETKNYWHLKDGKRPKYWEASDKRDGVFCHIERDTCVACSREGNRFPGLEKIEAQAAQVFRMFPYVTHLQGELDQPDWDFQKISSVVKSGKVSKEEKDKLQLYVFNVGGFTFDHTGPMLQSGTATGEVLKGSSDLINHCHIKYELDALRPIDFFTLNDMEVEETMLDAVERGFEGLVLRWPSSHGSPTEKQQRLLYKVKTFAEMDVYVEGFEEGKGHLVGHLGSLQCRGVLDDGTVVKVSVAGFDKIGHPWARWELWQDRLNLIGKCLEVRYDYTTNPNKETGEVSLRFPRFVKFKEDR